MYNDLISKTVFYAVVKNQFSPPDDKPNDGQEEKEDSTNGPNNHSGRKLSPEIGLKYSERAFLRRQVNRLFLRRLPEPSFLRIRKTFCAGADLDHVLRVSGQIF
jgi:hypothetical protein